jgi:tetratricopeptide (TPR) repeat protein/transglutaminase-like putative cysteine protease
MRLHIALVGFVLCVPLLQAQDQPPDRGVKTELVERVFRMENDGHDTATRTVRKRLLSEAGRAKLSPISFNYNAGYQELQIEYCRIIKPGGARISADLSTVTETAAKTGNLIFTNGKVKKLDLPGLQPGDVVEFRFTNRTIHPLKAGDFWRMEYRNPQAESETVVLDLPADREVAFKADPHFPFERKTSNGRTVHQWTLAKEKEPKKEKIAEDEDEPPLFAVSSVRTWKDLGEWVLAFEASRAVVTPEIRQLAEQLTRGKTNPRDKVQAIYQYVSNSIRYLSLSFELGGFQPHFAAETLKNGYGDCKDHHVLFAALLEAVGIKALGILITPGLGTPVPEVPSPDFAHAITLVELEGEHLWLDTTPRLAPMEQLYKMRGKQAFVAEPGKSRLETIPAESPVPDVLHVRIAAKLDAGGAFTTEKTVEARGWFEYLFRGAFASGEDKGTNLLGSISGIERGNNGGASRLVQLSYSHAADLFEPFSTRISRRNPMIVNVGAKEFELWLRSGSLLALAPRQSAYELAKLTGGLLDCEERLDMEVDPVWDVTTPVPVKVARSFGTYESTYVFAEGKLRIERKLHITNREALLKNKPEWAALSRLIDQDRGQSISIRRRSGDALLSAALEGLTARDFYTQGSGAYRDGRFELARDLFLKAAAKDPKQENVWIGVGLAYMELKQFDKAEEAYKKEFANNPQSQYVHRYLGQTYRQQGRYEEAIQEFRQQIEMNPLGAPVRTDLARTFALLGRWNEAAEMYAEAAKLQPKSGAAQAQLGRALLKAGKSDEGRQHFARALELDQGPTTLDEVAYFLAESGVDLPQAQTYAERAVASSSASVCQPVSLELGASCQSWLRFLGMALDTEGFVLFQQREFDKAEPYLVAARQIRPNSRVVEHLGLLRLRQGNADEAVEFYAESVRLREGVDFPPATLRAELEKTMAPAALSKAVADRNAIPRASGANIEWPNKAPAKETGKVTLRALVAEDGKIERAERVSGPESLAAVAVAEAPKLRLPAISWPGRTLRTVRLIELNYSAADKIDAAWTVAVQ